MSKSLPATPNLEHLRKQAKDLLAAYQDDDSTAVSLFQQHLPRSVGALPANRPSGFKLSDAQLVLAREYGFPSWPKLKSHVQVVSAQTASPLTSSSKTDWQLVRLLMNSVIDACQAVENLNLTDDEHNTPLPASPANVWDALQSSWIYPENVQNEVNGARHALGNDKHFTSESARALVNCAKVTADLIGAGKAQPIQDPVRKLAQWYSSHMVPQVTNSIEAKRKVG
jgi:hypothetical protein